MGRSSGQASGTHSELATSTVLARISRKNFAPSRCTPSPFRAYLSPTPVRGDWAGYVQEIKNSFAAALADITAGENTQEGELAEFLIADVKDDDRDLLKPGAIFRWVVGYQRSPAGTKRRVSDIFFRRLPAWSKRDLVRANEYSAGTAPRNRMGVVLDAPAPDQIEVNVFGPGYGES